ncbi:uncharacterized protein LOC106669949 isoform X2 [Cimex lectularius]|uniref:Uncharacterized protein n=1 Tax=Cimex lectularius TaxID=79782 RepID=A0A8I6S1E7_CIMLE|nr:uncharacterized protein LOC106669949 isoform X2 [Cimex lectularius]
MTRCYFSPIESLLPFKYTSRSRQNDKMEMKNPLSIYESMMIWKIKQDYRYKTRDGFYWPFGRPGGGAANSGNFRKQKVPTIYREPNIIQLDADETINWKHPLSVHEGMVTWQRNQEDKYQTMDGFYWPFGNPGGGAANSDNFRKQKV